MTILNKIKAVGLLLFALFVGQIAFSQTNKDKALEKGIEAIKLMDEGKVDESIKLLKEAQKLDPDRLDYPYELAYAYFLNKNYKGAIKLLEKNRNHKNVTERLFQLLGNIYDITGDSDKAFETYDAGLAKFPNSGVIILEKGNVHWAKKEYGDALAYYEKGIEVDPQFPSNYYRATLLYCNSSEEVWGLIYGEIFMNLERNSNRTSEISKLLFDVYKSEIKFTSDTSMTVSFCKEMTMNIEDLKDPENIKMPFCMIYEPTLLMSVSNEKSIDINSLDKIRTGFVENYFKMNHNKTYPNILFDYQNKMLELGHLEAYNHWILMMGDEDGFDKWSAENKDKWEKFIEWFKANALEVDESKRFSRTQY